MQNKFLREVNVIIKKNLEFIRDDVKKILEKNNMPKDSVNIVAVTKTVDIENIKEAIELGVSDIGENRVQELEKKINLLGSDLNYHMIGHLQTNKVKYIIDKVKLIHSLDRISLTKELNKQSKNRDMIIDALIQVNISEEESKFGLSLEEVIPFIEKTLEYPNVNIRGLMTIAPHTDDEKVLRDIFRKMYNLKEDIKSRNYKGLSMDFLSMGMTNDYRIAIEEGANIIRVGSGIFGERDYDIS